MFAREPGRLKVGNEDVLNADATQLKEMIISKAITSTEATKIYIEHITKMNPAINCIVENRFETALKEAQKADLQLAKGKATGKLFGVSISMKESFHVEGMQTTGALLRKSGEVQQQDAEVIKKLKKEGAIILGKSNTPELCFCQETDNKLYGRTNNPRDFTRTVGGSSGGEAAAIAIGGAAAGLGSDIGGSIRIPSHFNGVVGFKSGKGQVSSNGHFPSEEDPLQSRMLGIGPITKSVRDAELIYRMIAKTIPAKKDISNMTVTVLPATDYPLSPETTTLLQTVYDKLRAQFLVERAIPPYFHESSTLWQEIMSMNGGRKIREKAFGQNERSPMVQYVNEVVSGQSRHHRYLLWALIGASFFQPSEQRISSIKKKIKNGDALLNDYLEQRILVFPVYHRTAPEHGEVYKEIFSIRKSFKKYMPYLAYANVWGLPSLTIPVAKDREGMPIGLQIMSKNGNEDALFQYGALLEQSFLGYERVQL